MYAILLFLVLHHTLALFCQSAYLHRYAAHHQFRLSKRAEYIWNFLSWLFMGSSYLSPDKYGKLHIMHHRYPDSDWDVHNPKDGLIGMMLLTRDRYLAIDRGAKELVIDGKVLPVPEASFTTRHAIDTWGQYRITRLGWIAVYVGFYIAFAPSLWWFLLLPFHILNGPIHGAIINYFAHKFGYQNYVTHKDDQSRNFALPVDLMLGEGFHNNHHRNALNPNFGHKWWEIDLTYWLVLKPLSWMGIVKDLGWRVK